MRKVKFVGESEPGLLVFENLDYAPRREYSVEQVLATNPEQYDGQFFAMGEEMARHWGYIT